MKLPNITRWSPSARKRRRHETPNKDQREPFEVDRDRLQYSSAFHRLAGVTQIVRAGESGVFHTRQQHTYKVAQVGRRLAQHCIAQQKSLSSKLGLDAEVVEAACLAHDLGHPPFGHAGEEMLNKLVQDSGDGDGFEGNAQTFRVVTKLAVRFPEHPGLDLTRATLAACLKYPWLREPSKAGRRDKWGAYRLDIKDFEFARKSQPDGFQTTEAALMDWADDIAYSVHDLEDFHRVGAIPWASILFDSKDILISNTFEKWYGATEKQKQHLEEAFDRLTSLLLSGFGSLLLAPYEGSREQRVALRNLTSALIGKFIRAVTLVEDGSGVSIDEDAEAEVKILKQITRQYIIGNPSLIAQQHGQKKLISDLFDTLFANSGASFPSFLPSKLAYIWELSEGHVARFAADCIASLTESEVIGLHKRLFGAAAGSVLDPIVR